ncbi:nuclear transport factor 2 family protein [Pseudoalteromonas fenneropenaei]|uniref:Nuclear transport factor 2 family protein n=1 Tax=Pseudoalteromonas fenneropenaei TaxID=1737459 RepID=A0ABV7CFR0_9GAMM
MNTENAVQVIQRQLDAYNNKDLVALLNCYAEHSQLFNVEGEVLAKDKAHIAQNLAARFQEPDLYAELLERRVFDNVVIDHERITRNFPEGRGTIDMLCIYVVEKQLIVRGTFKVFNQHLF